MIFHTADFFILIYIGNSPFLVVAFSNSMVIYPIGFTQQIDTTNTLVFKFEQNVTQLAVDFARNCMYAVSLEKRLMKFCWSSDSNSISLVKCLNVCAEDLESIIRFEVYNEVADSIVKLKFDFVSGNLFFLNSGNVMKVFCPYKQSQATLFKNALWIEDFDIRFETG